MPRYSANLGFLWPDRPLMERIEAAARAGFAAVEMHWPYETAAGDVRAACERSGVALLGINTRPGSSFGLAALPAHSADFKADFADVLGWGRAAGARAIHVMAGVVPAEERAQARRVLVDNLRFAADAAPDLDLLLEPINPRDKPGYFYHRIDEALSVMADVGAPNLRLMFDTYHVGRTEGDVTTRLAEALPQVGHIQIAAVPTRAEPDEGELDYRVVLAAIDRFGYAGYVGLEYRPRGDTDAGLAWMRHIG